MDLQLKDKVIVVTGGAKGIGRGIAEVLAAEGAMVAIVGRNESDNLGAVQAIEYSGGRAVSVVAELSIPEDCKGAVEAIASRYGRIDGLVNNAGVNDGVGLGNGSYDTFISSLHKNLVHYYLMAHYALPYLKQSKGAIVNIGSKTAETGQGGTSVYAASNGGRNALTREWAVELLPYHIRVNSVIVAECFTPLYAKWIETFDHPAEKLADITRRIPLGKRMTTAEEIANMVAFLLSKNRAILRGNLFTLMAAIPTLTGRLEVEHIFLFNNASEA